MDKFIKDIGEFLTVFSIIVFLLFCICGIILTVIVVSALGPNGGATLEQLTPGLIMILIGVVALK